MHKGHYGEYSGNAKHSKVTASNYEATKKDDKAKGKEQAIDKKSPEKK